jgi:site-specific recombinase XerD
MIESGAMLTIWRRHTAECPHRGKGRDYLKCDCPLWAEPLADAIAAYLVNCQHLNANTQRKYRNRLQKQLQPFCERKGIDAVSELSTEVIDEFRAGRTLAPTTSARELETLRQFLSFCEARRWISDNPAKAIKTPKNIKPEPVVPYTTAEVDKILEAAAQIGKTDYERLRARAMVLLLRHTALRISDVALLERARVDGGVILLHTHKTGATIRLPIPNELQAALEAVPAPRGSTPKTSTHFFTNGAASVRTSISVAERCLRAVFKKSGVADAHAHRFRHTMATEILTNGGTMRDVADVLGISESIAAKHYAKWDQGRQDRIASLMRSIQSGTKKARGPKVIAIG